MQTYLWSKQNAANKLQILTRPVTSTSTELAQAVSSIIQQVKQQGDQAIIELSNKFDKVQLTSIKLSEQEIKQQAENISTELKQAINLAADNIKKFHLAQRQPVIEVEVMPELVCQQVVRPINSVGLYIPGGSAPLFSTVLMLAIPAQIAGCQRIVLTSPPQIDPAILYAANLCGIKEIYTIGGAQAIAALALGTETIPAVNKIFGPGNSFVTEAKRQVSQMLNACSIDMPAGPSEVLVIADEQADASFIAADLIAQAEHGPDSQVILLTNSSKTAEQVNQALDQQLQSLPRAKIAKQSLANSAIIITNSLAEAVEISNIYAPEHLIIQTENASQLVNSINNAGSVFLGKWSPESVGDYASGTNHVLPTYGYAKTYSSLGLNDFQKRMTIQTLSQQALLNIAPSVEIMATAENLIGHKQAVTIRVNSIKQ